MIVKSFRLLLSRFRSFGTFKSCYFFLFLFIHQTTVIKVYECVDWDIIWSSVIISQYGLNCLLHFWWRQSFIVFCGSFRHVEIQLKNIVKLIPRIKVSQAFSYSWIFRSRSLHTYSWLRSLGDSFSFVETRLLYHPIIYLLIPFTWLFYFLEIFRWNKIFYDHIFEL